MLAWALGSSMAAISGILLVPELGLQVEALTFLIINAFAAAIVGRLKSLPLTYVGAMVLGLVVSFQQSFLDWGGRWSTASFAIPTIFLFVALLALPQARIELRKPPPPSKILQPRVSKVWETALSMAVLWLVVFFFTRNMGTVNLNRVTLAPGEAQRPPTQPGARRGTARRRSRAGDPSSTASRLDARRYKAPRPSINTTDRCCARSRMPPLTTPRWHVCGTARLTRSSGSRKSRLRQLTELESTRRSRSNRQPAPC